MSALLAARPATMLAPAMTGAGQLSWTGTAVPPPGPGRILVRNLRSLISPGTELAFWTGIHPCIGDPAVAWAQWPFAPGYAALGVVEEAGGEVDGFAPGDRVLCACRHAPWASCDPGAELVAHVPAGVGERDAPFARLIQIVAGTTLALAGRPAGEVVVVGAGLIGLLAALWLRSEGIPATVEDLDPARRRIAEACALEARAPRRDDQPAAVVDATGVADLIPAHLQRIARGGHVVLLGSPRVPVQLDVYRLIHGKCAVLAGAHEGRFPTKGARSRQSLLEEALARIADGRIALGGLGVRSIPAAGLETAYRRLAERAPGWLAVELEWDHE